jgi:hypothetical protein
MIKAKTVDDYAARRELFMKSVQGTRFLAYVDTAWNPTIGWGFATNNNFSSEPEPRNDEALNYLLNTSASCKSPSASFRRRSGSSTSDAFWTPASAGVTVFLSFARASFDQTFRQTEQPHCIFRRDSAYLLHGQPLYLSDFFCGVRDERGFVVFASKRLRGQVRTVRFEE